MYYVVGSYKYDVLNDVLSNLHIGYGGYAVIVNQNGTICSAPDTIFVQNKTTVSELYEQNSDIITLFDRIYTGETGIQSMSPKWRKNIDFLYSCKRYKTWYMALFMPREEIKAGEQRVIMMNIMITILMYCHYCSSCYYDSRKNIKALGNVKDRIQKLAKEILQVL